MIDKLKLWNFVALMGSQAQYSINGNDERANFYRDVLTNIMETFNESELEWLRANAFSGSGNWFNPIEFQAELIQLIIDMDKPIKAYESMTEQLQLF